MACNIPIDELNVLSSCPTSGEYILFFNVQGEPALMALRTWQTILGCIGGKGVLNLIVGESGAPQNGESTWQSDSLIGLGGTLGRIQITLGEVPMSSYGGNASFSFDNTSGTINIFPNTFYEPDSLNVNLNQ